MGRTSQSPSLSSNEQKQRIATSHLADVLHGAGHTVYVINPRWIHLYAKGVGARGKTDRSDAALIARFVAAEARDLRPYSPPSAPQRQLRSLLMQRTEAAKLRAAARQSLGDEARGLVLEFNKFIRSIDRRVKALVEADTDWKDLACRLRTVPGVGPIVSAHLVQVLGRIPFSTADSLVAHAGLDPRPNDSGQKQGRRRLTCHGDAALRTMLYLAAMAASRQPTWRVIYQAQRDKGLSSTAALVVIARKILRIAFSLFKNGGAYEPERLGAA